MTRPITADDLGPLHLASTPVAVLSRLGLRTWAGVSGDDPGNTRHKDVSYAVVLSAYAGSRLLGRQELRALGPHEHVFLSLDDELQALGWQDATLCVVHRVPARYAAEGRIVAPLESGPRPDYSLYRTVVQYGSAAGPMGGVVYETPPNLNVTGRKPHYLSFTNKVYLTDEVDCHLVLLNYSVSGDYRQTAEARLVFHDASGRQVASETVAVPPYDYASLRLNDVLKGGPRPGIYSIASSTLTSSLIPLSLALHRGNGGVTVEHAHPPQEYWMADRALVGAMKVRAARHIFGA